MENPGRIFLAAMLVWLACLSPTALAQTNVIIYVLEDVWLLPDNSHPSAVRQMTGTFRWTYAVGDFENGSGKFIELDTPWYNPGIQGLNITIESTSIEFALVGNFHDRGLDLTLFLLNPLSTDQPAVVDTSRSAFDIQFGISHRGHVASGMIVPRLDLCLTDLDGDGQGNLADGSLFIGCMGGSGQPLAPSCEITDLDGDSDTDLTDFALFQAGYGCP